MARLTGVGGCTESHVPQPTSARLVELRRRDTSAGRRRRVDVYGTDDLAIERVLNAEDRREPWFAKRRNAAEAGVDDSVGRRRRGVGVVHEHPTLRDDLRRGVCAREVAGGDGLQLILGDSGNRPTRELNAGVHEITKVET